MYKQAGVLAFFGFVCILIFQPSGDFKSLLSQQMYISKFNSTPQVLIQSAYATGMAAAAASPCYGGFEPV